MNVNEYPFRMKTFAPVYMFGVTLSMVNVSASRGSAPCPPRSVVPGRLGDAHAKARIVVTVSDLVPESSDAVGHGLTLGCRRGRVAGRCHGRHCLHLFAAERLAPQLRNALPSLRNEWPSFLPTDRHSRQADPIVAEGGGYVKDPFGRSWEPGPRRASGGLADSGGRC
jgi:hypothetical protein